MGCRQKTRIGKVILNQKDLPPIHREGSISIKDFGTKREKIKKVRGLSLLDESTLTLALAFNNIKVRTSPKPTNPNRAHSYPLKSKQDNPSPPKIQLIIIKLTLSPLVLPEVGYQELQKRGPKRLQERRRKGLHECGQKVFQE